MVIKSQGGVAVVQDPSDAYCADMPLWAAVRAVEKRAALARRMVAKAREHKQSFSLKRFEAQARETVVTGIVVRSGMAP